MSEFYYMKELNVGILIFACMVVLSLFIGTLVNLKKKCTFMMIFSFLLICVFIMIAGEALLWGFLEDKTKVSVIKLGAFLSIGFGAIVNSLFIYCLISYVNEQQKVPYRYAHIFACFNVIFFLLVVLSFFNGLLFYVDENGIYHDGSAYYIVNIFDYITLIVEFFLVLHYRKILSNNAFYAMLSFSFLPLISMFLVPYWTPTPTYMTTTLSLLFILLLFHGEVTRQLLEKERILAETERQLADKRIAMALSQLKPHFLYNVLNSIYYLCDKNPSVAQEAVNYFSEYLRNNMASIEKKNMIPFDEELKHIESYLNLEKIRFKDLKIKYDIKVSSFMCPPLSVQPLVENAVKHGIAKKKEGGVVVISTLMLNDSYVIKVSDNGVGFVPNSYSDGKLHIGISNVRERIMNMAGGTLTISSELGVGSQAMITLPKKEAKL